MTTLFIISAMLLGAWFLVLRSLWQGPISPAAAMQDAPQKFETLVQQQLREVTRQPAAAEGPSR